MDDFYKNLLDNLHDGVYFTDRQRNIRYWNCGAERITGYAACDMVGRCCAEDILAHVDEHGKLLCTSDCPLSDSIRDGMQREKEIFLRHKQGHRVPVVVRVSPVRNGAGEIIGAVESFSDNSNRVQAGQQIEELQRLAFIDALTGVGNRRFGEIVVKARLEEFRRYGWQFGAVFIDIDEFKRINDSYGHQHGDEVIAMVARTLVANVRPFDFVARWGGDEFLVILTNVTVEVLDSLADKLRSLVNASCHPGSGARVSVSGGATMALPSDTVRSLVKRVDDLLYQSKAGGRNRVYLGL